MTAPSVPPVRCGRWTSRAPSHRLRASTPEAWSTFLDALEGDPQIEPHALIVHRHGRRIVDAAWAPHRTDRIRLVYSLSKTFTGTALALQVGEGRLSLDDLVSDHLPDLFDGTDERTRRLRIRHIASMASGHDREMLLDAYAADPADPVRAFFTLPPDAEPGTLFAYNQPPVLALATILTRLAGESLVDQLRPRVLDPLGIGDLRWSRLASGVELGFSGVYTSLDAVARLGQLYLDDGCCDGARLLPEGWVTDASRPHIDNRREGEPVDWQQGYGFTIWMSRHGYRGDGAYGQFMVVLPEYDAVVALFSCTEQMQTVLDLMWTHLLPAFGPAGTGAGRGPSAADEALAERVGSLSVPTAAERLGVAGGSVHVPDHQTFAPDDSSARSPFFAIDGAEVADGSLTIHEPGGSLTVPLTAGWSTIDDPPLAASATALPDGRIAVDLASLATPHRAELTLDPATSTFHATWPLVPLFGLGLSRSLSAMRPPD